MYGLYCASYPKEGIFPVTCPHCNETNNLTVSKEDLVEIKDDNAYDFIYELLNKNTNITL